MIDEKKIEEAAKMYAFHKCDERDIDQYDLDSLLFDAFLAGINWFEDNLWHDISECNEKEFDLHAFVLGVDVDGFFDVLTGAELNVKQTDYTKWLYIEDLMKGDKQC